MAALDSVAPLRKRPRREGFQYQMELNFALQEEKDQFLGRLDRVKQSLISKRRRSIDHLELLSFLLDLAEKVDQSEDQLTSISTSSSMLNRGVGRILRKGGQLLRCTKRAAKFFGATPFWGVVRPFFAVLTN